MSETQVINLLKEASVAYISNPTDSGKEEVTYYAQLLLSIRNSKD